jgi:EpsI family protein
MSTPRLFSWTFIATLLLLATSLAASRLTARRVSESLAEPLDTIGREIAGFTGADTAPLNDKVLAQLRLNSYLSRTYRQGDRQVDLFIAFYAQQRAGESMHSPKHCLPGAGWEIWDYGSLQVPVKGQRFTINKYSISNAWDRRVVLYWYQSKNRIIASEYLGKIVLARDALLQNSTAGSIVRVIVADRPGSLEYATNFASDVIAEVQRCFGR